MSYGTSVADAYRLAVINMKNRAGALGITFPLTLLGRAEAWPESLSRSERKADSRSMARWHFGTLRGCLERAAKMAHDRDDHLMLDRAWCRTGVCLPFMAMFDQAKSDRPCRRREGLEIYRAACLYRAGCF
jgi:hypothetical protein